jgi:hypothetical protein
MPSKVQARIRLLDEVAGGHRCTRMKELNRGGLSRRKGNSFPFSKLRIRAEIVCTQAGDEQFSGKQRCKLANVESDAGRANPSQPRRASRTRILDRARERAACLTSFELPLLHSPFAEEQPIEADFFLER